MDTSKSPTKWGICSAGDISNLFVISLNVKPEEHQAAAVAARDLDRAQKFAKKYSIPKAYGSYQELADDEEIEVVYIGTLHTQHLHLGLMMLEAGKHVLCEKPIGMNMGELNQLLNKAKEKNLFFMEAIRTRFQPASLRLMEEISKNTIGEVKTINVVLSNTVKTMPRLVKKELGGGGLIDFGIYGLAFVNMIFRGRPEKIIASGHLLDSGVDDVVSLTLFYSDNRMATVLVNTNTKYFAMGQVLGTEGTIQVPQVQCPIDFIMPSGERLHYPDPKGPKHLTPPESLGWSKNPQLDDMTGLIYEADITRECIKNGLTEEPKMSHEDSRIIKEIMDEARRQIGVVYDAD